jgi:hypothetical protein
MKAILDPRMVAAIIQPPFAGLWLAHGDARITASSQGGLPILAIVHSHPRSKPFGEAPIINLAKEVHQPPRSPVWEN